MLAVCQPGVLETNVDVRCYLICAKEGQVVEGGGLWTLQPSATGSPPCCMALQQVMPGLNYSHGPQLQGPRIDQSRLRHLCHSSWRVCRVLCGKMLTAMGPQLGISQVSQRIPSPCAPGHARRGSRSQALFCSNYLHCSWPAAYASSQIFPDTFVL
jgi:hypothetical protein